AFAPRPRRYAGSSRSGLPGSRLGRGDPSLRPGGRKGSEGSGARALEPAALARVSPVAAVAEGEMGDGPRPLVGRNGVVEEARERRLVEARAPVAAGWVDDGSSSRGGLSGP